MLLISTAVFASGENYSLSNSVTVYVTLSENGQFITGNDVDSTVLARVPVTVDYFDLNEYGLGAFSRYAANSFEAGGEYVDNKVIQKPTMLHLIIKLLEQYYLADGSKVQIGTAALSIMGSPTSMYMNNLWGHDENLMYYVNHQYPLMAEGKGATADYILLNDGMEIDLAMFPDWNFYETGAFAHFDKTTAYIASNTSITLNMQASPTRSVLFGEIPADVVMPNEGVMISRDLGTTWSRIGETNASGNVDLSFNTDGVYYVTFDKDNINYSNLANYVAPPISIIYVGDNATLQLISEIMALPVNAEYSPAQLDFLHKNPHYTQLRTQKDVGVLLNSTTAAIDNDSIAAASLAAEGLAPLSATAAITRLPLGQNGTYTSCGYTKTGKDYFLLATTSADANGIRARAKCETSIVGGGSSWAYSAKRIKITGTGSRLGYVTFNGAYEGCTSPQMLGGSAGALVRVSIFDLTTFTDLGGANILDAKDSFSSCNLYKAGFVKKLPIMLEGGHTYLLRFGVSTSVSNFSEAVAVKSDFYRPSDDWGIKVGQISITY